MSLKIKSSSLLESRVLEIDAKGVKYTNSAGFGGGKRFAFDRIDCILLAPGGELSFQVGNEIFRVPVKTDNPKHQQVIETLLQEVRRANLDVPHVSAPL